MSIGSRSWSFGTAMLALTAGGTAFVPGTSADPPPAPPNGLAYAELNAVSVLSATDAWAVGESYARKLSAWQTLTMHWDGRKWRVVPSPSPPAEAGDFLYGIKALSSSDVWAVGETSSRRSNATLIEHWDGSTWSVVPSPDPGPPHFFADELNGIDAVSADDVWAVGDYQTFRGNHTLVEHWNGTRWTVVSTPHAGGHIGAEFEALTAVRSNDLWAVGLRGRGRTIATLIEHWDGSDWKAVPSPNPGPLSNRNLSGVDAVSSGDVWTVGTGFSGHNSRRRGISLHWDGASWRAYPGLRIPGHATSIRGVSADSSKDVWAVGSARYGNSSRTFIGHWNGMRWVQVASPSFGQFCGLAAVDAPRSDLAISVGSCLGHKEAPAMLMWDGNQWTRMP